MPDNDVILTEELLQRAKAGGVSAQTIVGICYLEGYDTEIDYAEALRWLSPPSEQGVPRACYHLGRMYAEGLGIPADMARAIDLWKRSAKGSEYFAQIALARAYALGQGIPVDVDAARHWYTVVLARIAHLEIEDEETLAELEEARAYLEG
jgi:TPR repeat protein